MYPNQPGNPQPPQYPPQPPQPAAGYPPQQPQAYPPQPATQQTPGYQTTPPQPAAWYPQTSTPPPAADKPASADTYLQQAQAAAAPQNPAGFQGSGQGEYSIDYLNQIAAPTAKTISNKVLYGIAGGLGVIFLIMGIFLFMPKQTATTPAPSQLYMTMVDTQQVTNTASKQIRDSQLDKINSNLNTLLIGATASMDEPLSKTGLKASKLKSDTPKQAHDQKLVDALKEAQLNVVYDRVYASRMLIKVQAIIMLMDKTKQTSSSKSMQDFVSTQKPSFEAVKKSFEDYNKGTATIQ